MKLDRALDLESRLHLLKEADYLACLQFVEILTKELKKNVTRKNCEDVEEFSDKFFFMELNAWCRRFRARTSTGRK